MQLSHETERRSDSCVAIRDSPVRFRLDLASLLLDEEKDDHDDQHHRTKAAQPGVSIEEVADGLNCARGASCASSTHQALRV